MSKQMESNSLAAFPPAVQAFWNCGVPSVDTAVRNYTAWLGDFSRLQNETLRFLSLRLFEDHQAAAQIAASKSPTEAFDLQVENAGKVVAEFMAEGKTMLELCGQLATSGLPKQP